jgi:hypothetical protein
LVDEHDEHDERDERGGDRDRTARARDEEGLRRDDEARHRESLAVQLEDYADQQDSDCRVRSAQRYAAARGRWSDRQPWQDDAQGEDEQREIDYEVVCSEAELAQRDIGDLLDDRDETRKVAAADRRANWRDRRANDADREAAAEDRRASEQDRRASAADWDQALIDAELEAPYEDPET